MTYFVTGATGFIGRRLLVELVATRKGPIHVLVRPGSEDKLERFAYQWNRSSRVKIVPGELTEQGQRSACSIARTSCSPTRRPRAVRLPRTRPASS